MDRIVYYFSGTGNSYRIAKDVAAQLIQTELVSISQQQVMDNTNSSVIGIVFPLYYFGLPIIVEEFIRDLKIPAHCYVFVLITRGHYFAGGAKKQLDELLLNKGKEYQLFRYITMGDNYPFYMFNGSKSNRKCNRNEKAKKKTEYLVKAIHMRKKSRIFSIMDYQPFFWLTRYMPIFGYHHFRHIYNNDTYFTVCSDKCTKCKRCEKVCPVNNITVNDKVLWKQADCQLCLACYNVCPTNAIQYIDKGNHVNTTGKRQYWNY